MCLPDVFPLCPSSSPKVRSRPNQEWLQDKNLAYSHLRKMKGTSDYMNAARKACYAMLRQLGPPTFFFTLTSRAIPWPELIRVLSLLVDGVHVSDQEIKAMSKWDRKRLIRTDPVTCSRMYSKRVDNYLHLLRADFRLMGGMVAHFAKEEWQRGGDEHTHAIAWTKDPPTFKPDGDNSELLKFTDRYITCSSFMLPRSLLQVQIHRHVKLTCMRTKQHSATCRFRFPRFPMLATVILTGFPEFETSTGYVCHELVQQYKERRFAIEAVMREMQDTAINFDPRGKYNRDTDKWLLPRLHLDTDEGTVQDPPAGCTDSDPAVLDAFWHNYWLDYLEISEEDYILAIRTSIGKPTLFLKRKFWEMSINGYGRHMSELWNANTDVQIVLQHYEAVTYICCYLTKLQKGVCELMDRLRAMLLAQPNASLYKVLQRITRKHIVTQQVGNDGPTPQALLVAHYL